MDTRKGRIREFLGDVIGAICVLAIPALLLYGLPAVETLN